MTPEEWDAATDWRPLIEAAGSRVSWRKWRLFAAAACRDARRFHLLPAVADAITLAERFAEGLVEKPEMERAYHASRAAWGGTEVPLLLHWATSRGASLAWHVADILDRAEHAPARRAVWLREVVGDPFRWVRWEDEWVTRTAHELVADAYATARFDGLPVLADALEDAGCDNPELLAHLRGSGPHARGCWALDVILGRT